MVFYIFPTPREYTYCVKVTLANIHKTASTVLWYLKGIVTSVSQVMVSLLLVLLSQQDNLKGAVAGEFYVNVFSTL